MKLPLGGVAGGLLIMYFDSHKNMKSEFLDLLKDFKIACLENESSRENEVREQIIELNALAKKIFFSKKVE